MQNLKGLAVTRSSTFFVLISVVAACGITGCTGHTPPPPPPPPALGEETIPPGEATLVAQTTDIIEATLKRRQAESGDEILRRDAHAKAHGCVHAKFEVNNDIPSELHSEVFAPGKSYSAWVRFSNSGGAVGDDKTGDGRGLAIKLIGVPGEKLLEAEAEATTQDFLLINHPTFFIPDADAYLHFATHDSRNNPVAYFLAFGERNAVQLRGLNIARLILTKKLENPLTETYHSMTPFRHGAAPAVKYRARPCDGKHGATVGDHGPNTLAVALEKSLASDDACFVFEAQVQTDAVRMPIEDATVAWAEADSPFVPVATLHIAPQSFTAPAQTEYCEAMRFTPWHSTASHRPLGSLNRLRKVVYNAIAELRHEANGVTYVEPTSLERFSAVAPAENGPPTTADTPAPLPDAEGEP